MDDHTIEPGATVIVRAGRNAGARADVVSIESAPTPGGSTAWIACVRRPRGGVHHEFVSNLMRTTDAMSSFRDGPAAGSSLLLHRAPRFLRVVVSPTGKVDALDQPDDTPKPRETIHVYRRIGQPVQTHLNFGSTAKGSGFYAMGEYEHVPDVEGESVRDTDAWRAWCVAAAAADPVE